MATCPVLPDVLAACLKFLPFCTRLLVRLVSTEWDHLARQCVTSLRPSLPHIGVNLHGITTHWPRLTHLDLTYIPWTAREVCSLVAKNTDLLITRIHYDTAVTLQLEDIPWLLSLPSLAKRFLAWALSGVATSTSVGNVLVLETSHLRQEVLWEAYALAGAVHRLLVTIPLHNYLSKGIPVEEKLGVGCTSGAFLFYSGTREPTELNFVSTHLESRKMQWRNEDPPSGRLQTIFSRDDPGSHRQVEVIGTVMWGLVLKTHWENSCMLSKGQCRSEFPQNLRGYMMMFLGFEHNIRLRERQLYFEDAPIDTWEMLTTLRKCLELRRSLWRGYHQRVIRAMDATPTVSCRPDTTVVQSPIPRLHRPAESLDSVRFEHLQQLQLQPASEPLFPPVFRWEKEEVLAAYAAAMGAFERYFYPVEVRHPSCTLRGNQVE